MNTRNRRNNLKNLKSIPGKRICSNDGKNASKSMIARGVNIYLKRLRVAVSRSVVSVLLSTEAHRRSMYSVAKMMVESISIQKNTNLYSASSEAIDSNTMQVTLMLMSEMIKIEKILEVKSLGSVISNI